MQQNSLDPGWSPTEMAALAGTMITNLAAAAGVIFSIPADQIGHFNAAMTKALTAGFALAANAVIAWKYLQGRTAIRTETIRANAVAQKAESAANAQVATAQINAQSGVQAAPPQVQHGHPSPTP